MALQEKKYLSTVKSIFNLEYAKIVLNQRLEDLLGASFTSLDLVLNQTEVVIKIYTYKDPLIPETVQTKVKKEELTDLCKEVLSWYCKFPVKVIVISALKDFSDTPMYYYRLLLKRTNKGKVNLFSALSKLEKIKLSPHIKGLLIRVKGKRGTRKDKKILLLGNPCRHSNKKNLLVKGNYTVETNLGSYGVKILLLKNESRRTQ